MSKTLSEMLDQRIRQERAARETGHNAADRERSELIKLLDEAAALARRVESSAKAIGSRDACTDECASIIMHIGNGGRAKDARGKWFHLVPVGGGA